MTDDSEAAGAPPSSRAADPDNPPGSPDAPAVPLVSPPKASPKPQGKRILINEQVFQI
jgi:hypothetical protein